jgi:hypothetical protein
MSIAPILALVASGLACSPATTPGTEAQEPEGEEVGATTREPAEPDFAEPASPAAATTADEPARTPTRVEAALGAETVATIRSPARVLVGRLGIEGVLQAEQKALQDESRICGYPISSKLRPLQPEEAASLGALLLADESYQFDLERRCKNARNLGARFEGSNGERVEAILGVPCDQLRFSWRRAGAVEQWGSITTEEASAEIAAIIEGSTGVSGTP